MKQDEHVNQLLKSANEKGVVSALDGMFGKCVKVSIPFGQKARETSIDELDFSVRAGNAMKRGNVFTIGQVIDLIADDGLLRIRNLGKKTQNEIKTRILAFGYERLTELEKKRFFYDIVERNCVASYLLNLPQERINHERI